MGTWDSVRLLCAQFISFPYPTTKFTGKSIIVTGSNVGLGLEAARHFVRLNAGKVILAVRNASKGEDAARSITESTGRHDVVEVWELDLACRDSVKAFARRAQGLERLDVVVENAAINLTEFQMEEDNESTITVNVINTLLLALLLLPMLRKSSVKYKADTVLTFTGSFVHYLTQFPERKSPNIFKELANPKMARMNDRYNVSKMMQLLLVRELANQVTASNKNGRVIVSVLNPGWVRTDLDRLVTRSLSFSLGRKYMARDAEVGSRTLVDAANGAPETHGQYLSDCRVSRVSNFVTSKEGAVTQKELWKELSEILEDAQPGILESI